MSCEFRFTIVETAIINCGFSWAEPSEIYETSNISIEETCDSLGEGEKGLV